MQICYYPYIIHVIKLHSPIYPNRTIKVAAPLSKLSISTDITTLPSDDQTLSIVSVAPRFQHLSQKLSSHASLYLRSENLFGLAIGRGLFVSSCTRKVLPQLNEEF